MDKSEKDYNRKIVEFCRSNGNHELIKHPNREWYKIEDNARLLSHDFRKYVLALRIVYNINNEEYVAFQTGSPLVYNNKYLWLTAGHVIKNIRSMLRDQSYKIRNMDWVDNYKSEDAKAIPISDFHSLTSYHIDNNEQGDIGFVQLDKLTSRCLMANNDLRWLDDHMWKNISRADADGYFLVGFPHEMTACKIEKKGKYFEGRTGTYLICVPIERIDNNAKREPEDFWNNPNFIYAKMTQVHKQDGEPLQKIGGMSGGLIFSVETEEIYDSGESSFRYRLYGIQSSWLEESKVIRATRIEKVIEFLDQNIDK